jgi:DNA-binding transcriptional LysR family regulator
LPAAFQRRYPDIQVYVYSTERRMDLIEHGIDVALRVGAIVHEAMVARHVLSFRNVLVASSKLVKRFGMHDGTSNRNPLDFVEGDRIAGAVVKLGGARAFVRGHQLGVFERSTIVKIGGYAGCTEAVAADPSFEVGIGSTAADHLIGVDAVHGPFG